MCAELKRSRLLRPPLSLNNIEEAKVTDDPYVIESRKVPPNRISAILANVPVLVQLLSLVTGVLGILVPGLGYLTHERRVLMLSLPREALEYGPYQAALTGFSVCWHLPWRMAYAATSGNGWVLSISLGILAILLTRGAIFRRCRRSPAKALVVLLLVQIPVVLVSLGYSLAVTLARNDAAEHHGKGPITLPERARFETRSWIENPTIEYRCRATELAGLSGWLMLLTVIMLRESRRHAAGSEGMFRTCFSLCGAGFLMLAVFLCGQIPTAHAYAQWGFSYPVVAEIATRCDEDLAKSLKGDTVRAWDISIGAKSEYLLVHRTDSARVKWFLRPVTQPGGGRCSSLAAETVIPPELDVTNGEARP